MATCQYIADSAPLPPPHLLLEEPPALISAARVRVLGAGSLPTSATIVPTAA
jgi:hypothetical protein